MASFNAESPSISLLKSPNPGALIKQDDIDPLELFNVISDKTYANVVKEMKETLYNKMLEIGDEPAHDR